MIPKKIEELISELAMRYGFDAEADLNFTGTGCRVAMAYNELLAGYQQNAKEILKADFPAGDYDQMIVLKDINFYSLCSHHMLPFYGKAAVGYIPGKVMKGDAHGPNLDTTIVQGKVVGLSKLARIVEMYARRFQIQERMTQEIATTLDDHLKPCGVGVVVKAEHLCMKMRGVKQYASEMITSCLLGEFRDDAAVRQEFFSMIGR